MPLGPVPASLRRRPSHPPPQPLPLLPRTPTPHTSTPRSSPAPSRRPAPPHCSHAAPSPAEAYANISHQTLEVMRVAAADPGTTHVLKTDDDSYVHLDRLLRRLPSLPRCGGTSGRRPRPRGPLPGCPRCAALRCAAGWSPLLVTPACGPANWLCVPAAARRCLPPPAAAPFPVFCRERLFFGNIENPGGKPHREPGHQWCAACRPARLPAVPGQLLRRRASPAAAAPPTCCCLARACRPTHGSASHAFLPLQVCEQGGVAQRAVPALGARRRLRAVC